MMTLYPKLIEEALATVIYPGTKKNLIESEMLADTPSINGMKVKVVLLFPRDTDPFLRSTQECRRKDMPRAGLCGTR